MATIATRRPIPRAPTLEAEPIDMLIAVAAADCYRVFCEVERMPRWMPVVRSVRVRSRTASGLPREVALLSSLQRATIGYSLTYAYRPADKRISWSTPRASNIQILGWAAFEEEGPAVTRLRFESVVSLGGAMMPWGDPDFEEDPRGAAAAGFASYVTEQGKATR